MSWPLVKLMDLVVSMHQGINTAADKVVYSTGKGTPIIQSKHFTSGRLSLENTKLLNDTDTDKYKEKYTINEGDVLLSNIGTVGKSIVVEPNNCFMFAWNVFRIKVDSTKLFNKYLNYYFKHLDSISYYERLFTGGTVKFINKKNIGEIQIPLPPLDEQKRIAAILDKADAIRRKRQQAIQLADDFLRSVFLDMFGDPITNSKGWDIKKLNEVGILDRGKSKHRPRNDPKLLGGEHPLIQTGDVAKSGGYITSYSATYSDFGLAQSRKWKAGTLCITIAANIAKTGILTFEACFPDSVVGFKPNQLVTTEYVQTWLSFLQKILEANAPESAQKNINLAILRDLDIPLPPIEQQVRFTNTVEKINEINRKFNNSNKLKGGGFNSLSQKAFAGDL